MNSFDIVGALRTYAYDEDREWVFIYGRGFVQNYEATKSTITTNQLILAADPFIARPQYSEYGKLSQITYTGIIMLGRKFEASTLSNLDETDIQKYDRRLLTLSQTLSTNIIAFACEHELTLQSVEFELELNQLDENIDFVAASVTILQII